MAFDQRRSIQIVWAVALTAMGVLLCVKTPYVLEASSGSLFLKFARYFIGIFLIGGGVRKLYWLYFSNHKGWWNRKKSELDGKAKSSKFKARKFMLLKTAKFRLTTPKAFTLTLGILGTLAHFRHFLLLMTKDAAQHRNWTFSEAVMLGSTSSVGSVHLKLW